MTRDRSARIFLWGFLALALLARAHAQQADEQRLYRFLIQQNKAQLVMLREAGLMAKEPAGKIARALREADIENRANSRVSANYLHLEEQLIEKAGEQASNIHMGRSRNDLGATSERMVMREEILALLGELSSTRAAMLTLAEQHIHTVIPGYTHSVQAQPTSLAHHLSAFVSSMERDEQRLREAYARINASPLGAAAFTTSGIRLNRPRLAELLGFPALVENSYDAIMVSTVDSKAELAAALSVCALNVGRFAQQFLIQYSDSQPGLNLADEAVGHSSIMPQKRNPRQAERVRILASSVIGDAHTVLITAHNTPGGEAADFRVHLVQRVETVTRNANEMLRTTAALVNAIRVDPARTFALVNDDYSVMTEFADTLLREAGVPFRTGHKVAAALAAYGRAAGKRPTALSTDEIAQVYRTVTGSPLPISAHSARQALDARHFVASRRGIGGPQPEEMQRILQDHRGRVDQLETWVQEERLRMKRAQDTLDAAFAKLLTN